jgi:hypothetical protein
MHTNDRIIQTLAGRPITYCLYIITSFGKRIFGSWRYGVAFFNKTYKF